MQKEDTNNHQAVMGKSTQLMVWENLHHRHKLSDNEDLRNIIMIVVSLTPTIAMISDSCKHSASKDSNLNPFQFVHLTICGTGITHNGIYYTENESGQKIFSSWYLV